MTSLYICNCNYPSILQLLTGMRKLYLFLLPNNFTTGFYHLITSSSDIFVLLLWQQFLLRQGHVFLVPCFETTCYQQIQLYDSTLLDIIKLKNTVDCALLPRYPHQKDIFTQFWQVLLSNILQTLTLWKLPSSEESLLIRGHIPIEGTA